MKYEQESKQIIEAAGGKENILQVAHCMTRLRLEIADLKRVNQEAIKKGPRCQRYQNQQWSTPDHYRRCCG